ncbi:peptidoglycan-binding protein [Kovacikia minuta CCNUW1]|uniref:peptidoglycan-binding protein n=1 Tax=Kovacikia minuta TaxID=2931930 RepID=UPI001CCA9F8B|nr:peptidoglycan-binding protein [Kovacikia minuta]UBF25883.1 peptidoglycan-binding protein [Kovacikia minuta CCNUW1]
MESLAFIHSAVDYEDPNPNSDLKLLENFDLKVSNTALMGLAGAAIAVTVFGGTSDKAMAATASVAPGSSGDGVLAVQKALGIEADGQFGPKTQSAVMDFQIRQGLKEIDGVVGKETAQALGLDENYRPVGFVETNTGIGLNIRKGPGIGYWVIGGAPDGAFLEQDYETVIYNDGYSWTPLYTGGWVASDYTTEGYSPVSWGGGGGCRRECGGGNDYPVSYGGGRGHDEGYYPVSYDRDGGYVETRYRVGLNVRSGPGLDYYVIGGANEGSYVGTYGGVIYRDGYAWQQADNGAWVATNYLY